MTRRATTAALLALALLTFACFLLGATAFAFFIFFLIAQFFFGNRL